jgi:hypothetical protein
MNKPSELRESLSAICKPWKGFLQTDYKGWLYIARAFLLAKRKYWAFAGLFNDLI